MKHSIQSFAMIAIFLTSSTLVFSQDQKKQMQYFRYNDQRGVNVFETPVQDSTPFNGMYVRVGGHFALQFQGLDHSHSTAAQQNPNNDSLMKIAPGFNLATANLTIDVQLEDGIRLNLVTYLSSRHHPEPYVKGGYLQVDRLTVLEQDWLDKIMEPLTIKVGHMEINYGDAHFRRTDNGNAMYNPFIGNNIMDAFTTEIAAEIYFQKKNFLVMGAMSGGQLNPDVSSVSNFGPSLYGKLGYDKQFNEDFRFRLTGSVYGTLKSGGNTLYGGDRTGSRFYYVTEDENATAKGNFTSGRLNPGFRSEVIAVMFNPFIKWKGLELFGTIEQSTGKSSSTDTTRRTWNQYGAELIYRFFEKENVFVGGKYVIASGELDGYADPVSINRMEAGLGWFVTRNILTKVAYINQDYVDYPTGDRFDEMNFNGVMIEAVIGF